jgi:ATP-dependent RNA circularization protein (DNA/RNA ligase family)
MVTYPKINSIYKRDEHGQFTHEYACPEYGYLAGNSWVATEKLDGTNIRIGWEGGEVVFAGRTNRAIIPDHLLDYLKAFFPVDDMGDLFGDGTVLFGEGIGPKIQGNPYKLSECRFVLFDVWVRGWWLQWATVRAIAHNLGVESVPFMGYCTLHEVVPIIRAGVQSKISDVQAEGMVLRPDVQMLYRNGNPIKTKIKTQDFK